MNNENNKNEAAISKLALDNIETYICNINSKYIRTYG